MKSGGFFSALLHPVWFSSHLTFNVQNIFGVWPKLKLLYSRPRVRLFIQKLPNTVGTREVCMEITKQTTPLTVMYEILP